MLLFLEFGLSSILVYLQSFKESSLNTYYIPFLPIKVHIALFPVTASVVTTSIYSE